MTASDFLAELDNCKYQDEESLVVDLLESSKISGELRQKSFEDAVEIVKKARRLGRPVGVLETFLEEFGLTTKEGLALMCLAEGLLRIPDVETADKLIGEKIASGDWSGHLGESESILVNASVLGLMLTGKIVDIGLENSSDFTSFMHKLTRKAGEPVIRAAVNQAMRIMGEQFVLGRNISEAMKRGKKAIMNGAATAYSFDMLGEGARNDNDANRYFESYLAAIEAMGRTDAGKSLGPILSSGISVKLSALHARYDVRQSEAVFSSLYPRLIELARAAAKYDIGFCIDAEEADRLGISLQILRKLSAEPSLKNWRGLGLAVQAYQKRVGKVIGFVGELARQDNRQIMMRLVKGAYWDAEIKRAQSGGRPDFPVFTTKSATDVSYIDAANHIFAQSGYIYPQFATHNAHSLATIINLAKQANSQEYEFQRLHGMGDTLYQVAREIHDSLRLRIYAPVGAHEDLLPYLVRRLLENGANTSFVHAFLDEKTPVEQVVADPYEVTKKGPKRHPKVALPANLFGQERENSKGFDLSIARTVHDFEMAMAEFDSNSHVATSIIDGVELVGAKSQKIHNPANVGKPIGDASFCDLDWVPRAAKIAHEYQKQWDNLGGEFRADILEKMADKLETNALQLFAVLSREAGKTWEDGISEVREAVDFLRYYAAGARKDFAKTKPLPGPAGEINEIGQMGRGVFVCISPWNFPLAIFVGQIAAALAAGNTVLAKPAEQTPLIAKMAVKLFFEAGLPTKALQLLLGDGEIGGYLVGQTNIAGVAFTGSTEVAQIINRSLAKKNGAISTLIAETGGLNAMFVDTSALKEQVVDDVIISAFGSAGQRCSALRVLYLPNETADEIIAALCGAMSELKIGAPNSAAIDIGPVIDIDALKVLERHKADNANRVIFQLNVDDQIKSGTFFGPCIIELNDIDELQAEVFGPILHIIRYEPRNIDEVGAKLAAKNYGLTLGCHSRLDSFVEKVRLAVPAGNYYVNRSMIGAVVGVQPFGGLGLSGTGPKAGGPHYLSRFATEYVISTNIAAKGGDPTLFNL
jgi:RHH-type proline utilization regulon transcriptional repressor/proline dehydrogenase/delta 1-pyrroline-5-carboxylate dehydrogenase